MAWKPLDFKVKTKDTKEVIQVNGEDKELRVPEDYEPPPFVANEQQAQSELPSFVSLRQHLSLNNGDNPKFGYGQVDSQYIFVDEKGKLHLYDSNRLQVKLRPWRYVETKTNAEDEEYEVEKAFSQRGKMTPVT